jgi:methionyl aminopeptidase
MIIYKTQNEINLMAEGGKILAKILQQVSAKVKPGIGTKELNDLAESLILKNNGVPAFKNYKSSEGDQPFPSTLCTSINNEVVHSPAEPDRILQPGDIIGLDIGMSYKGYFTDMAVTLAVGNIRPQTQKLLTVTKESLDLGIAKIKENVYLSEIAKVIQDHVEKNGFSVVRELVGHGVGKFVHEDPRVPNYVTEESKTIQIKKGMTLAFEPMVNAGDWKIKILEDDFTYATDDGSLSAQFEHTVALDHQGKTKILTKI